MQTSAAGLKFIAGNEGFTPTVKGDYGRFVIGCGHDLLPGESFPNGITEAEANVLLQNDVNKVDAAMNAQHLGLDFNQNQWDAVADFTFECGVGALTYLLAHGVEEIPTQLPRWIHAGGQVLPGMVARRAAEVQMYNTPV
jgi:GH24 family phage-related lysozyme (muramidase)